MDALAYFLFGVTVVSALVYLKERYFGFTAQKPGDYALADQTMDLKQHLNGPILCEGVIYGPMGRVTSRFVGHFHVSWDGDTGVMAERFEYDSGDVQHRSWTLTLGQGGSFTATAADLVGIGEGWQSGQTICMRYRIRLPADAGGHVLTTTDWMYLAPNGTIINRSQFRKYGIKVAELVATMRRKEDM